MNRKAILTSRKIFRLTLQILLGSMIVLAITGYAAQSTINTGSISVVQQTVDHSFNIPQICRDYGITSIVGYTPSDGNDLLIGTDGADSLDGGNGNDCIIGNGGDDLLEGGNGDDVIVGGLGADTISGGGGINVIFGGAGNDTISGGNRSDLVYGEDGSDTINGAQGDDSLYGGSGDDFLYGENGKDNLSGGDGADSLDGGMQTDICTVDVLDILVVDCETIN
jgi:Ca2+-binding RTX toxin-like protein